MKSCLIVGASPAGLATAILIKLRNPLLDVKVFEPDCKPETDYVVKVNKKTLQKVLGSLEKVTASSKEPAVKQFKDLLNGWIAKDKSSIVEISVQDLEGGFRDIINVLKIEIESSLLSAKGENNKADLASILDKENFIEQLLKDYKPDMIIGADGLHSKVREYVNKGYEELIVNEVAKYIVQFNADIKCPKGLNKFVLSRYVPQKFSHHLYSETILDIYDDKGKKKSDQKHLTLSISVDKETYNALCNEDNIDIVRLRNIAEEKIEKNKGIKDLYNLIYMRLNSLNIGKCQELEIMGGGRVTTSALTISKSENLKGTVCSDRDHNNMPIPVTLVGDAAFCVPYSCNFDNALLCANELSKVNYGQNISNSFDFFNGYILFVKKLFENEVKKAHRKNFWSHFGNLVLKIPNVLPIQIIPARVLGNKRKSSRAKNTLFASIFISAIIYTPLVLMHHGVLFGNRGLFNRSNIFGAFEKQLGALIMIVLCSLTFCLLLDVFLGAILSHEGICVCEQGVENQFHNIRSIDLNPNVPIHDLIIEKNQKAFIDGEQVYVFDTIKAYLDGRNIEYTDDKGERSLKFSESCSGVQVVLRYSINSSQLKRVVSLTQEECIHGTISKKISYSYEYSDSNDQLQRVKKTEQVFRKRPVVSAVPVLQDKSQDTDINKSDSCVSEIDCRIEEKSELYEYKYESQQEDKKSVNILHKRLLEVPNNEFVEEIIENYVYTISNNNQEVSKEFTKYLVGRSEESSNSSVKKKQCKYTNPSYVHDYKKEPMRYLYDPSCCSLLCCCRV